MIDHHHTTACAMPEALVIHWASRAPDAIPLPDGSPWPAIEELRSVGGSAAFAALSLIVDRGPLGAVILTVDTLHFRSTHRTADGLEPIAAVIGPYPFTLTQLIRAGSN